MTGIAMPAPAISEESIATRLGEQHERKILGAHCWLHCVVNVFRPHNLLHNRRGKARLFTAIHRRWIVAMEADIYRTVISRSNVL